MENELGFDPIPSGDLIFLPFRQLLKKRVQFCRLCDHFFSNHVYQFEQSSDNSLIIPQVNLPQVHRIISYNSHNIERFLHSSREAFRDEVPYISIYVFASFTQFLA